MGTQLSQGGLDTNHGGWSTAGSTEPDTAGDTKKSGLGANSRDTVVSLGRQDLTSPEFRVEA